MSTPSRSKIYRVTSLGGRPLSDAERTEALAAAADSPIFRSVIQIVEEELDAMRLESTDPKNLKDGTQPHFAGAADGLNGALLRIAEAVIGKASKPKSRQTAA